MQAPLRVLMLTTALLATTAWTVAAEQPPAEPTASGSRTVATTPEVAPGEIKLDPETAQTGPVADDSTLGEDPSPRSALLRDIMVVFDAAKAQVMELEAKAEAARDEMEFLSIQREIERLHRGTELRILQIQADYLRREGHVDAAERIEAAIAEASAPRPVAQPVDRPAPSDPVRP